MAKVYVVYRMYHEHDDLGEDVYNSDSISKIFDSEDKAINFICDQVKFDHECVDETYPDDEHVTKYYPDRTQIHQGEPVMSYEYSCLTYILESHRYESYDVE